MFLWEGELKSYLCICPRRLQILVYSQLDDLTVPVILPFMILKIFFYVLHSDLVFVLSISNTLTLLYLCCKACLA
jgi:hypothetical protein